MEQQNESRPLIITAEGDIHGEDTPENRELVRRIHACVNACDGISTEDLEQGVIGDMCRTMSQVIPLLEEREQLSQLVKQVQAIAKSA